MTYRALLLPHRLAPASTATSGSTLSATSAASRGTAGTSTCAPGRCTCQGRRPTGRATSGSFNVASLDWILCTHLLRRNSSLLWSFQFCWRSASKCGDMVRGEYRKGRREKNIASNIFSFPPPFPRDGSVNGLTFPLLPPSFLVV